VAAQRLVHLTTVPDALIFLRDQVAFMVAQGFDVTVISSPGVRLDDFAAREGASKIAIPMTRRMTPLRDIQALARLWSTLRRIRPEIVHAHTPKAGLLGMMAASLAGVPTRLYHLHGLPLLTARGPTRWILAVTERLSCALATQVLCVGGSLEDAAVVEGLVSRSKSRVLGAGSINGVDAQARFAPDRYGQDARRAERLRLGIPPDALVFSFVGRVVRDKGLEELMNAWEVVSAALPHARLLVVGEVEIERDALDARLVRRMDDTRTVVRSGFVDELGPTYAASDVVVLPTHREGFPNVPLEAAAMALPVITTRAVGARDSVIDGVTGTLVAVGDAQALADAMIAYGRDADRRREHGRAGRRWVCERFVPDVLWRAILAIYRDGPEPVSGPGKRRSRASKRAVPPRSRAGA
jgi:glycosyltransferase involved in cell wall biosynthesis